MDIKKIWDEKGADILTGLGVLGVFGTAVLAVRDTPKALQLIEQKEQYKIERYGYSLTRVEKVLAGIPGYLPTILMATATISCIIGSRNISAREKAALTSAYIALRESYDEYRQKVKDVFGEKAEAHITTEIIRDTTLREKYGDIFEDKLFYDEYGDRYFKMSMYELQNNLYDVNRMYNHLGEMSLNDFYEFFNLDGLELGDKIGWNAYKDWECAGFSWIQLLFDEFIKDGEKVLSIKLSIEPDKDFKDWGER